MSSAAPPTPPPPELRPLTDRAEVGALAELHRAAFVGAESTRLGLPYLTAFFDWYRSTPGVVALVAGDVEPLGFVLGSPFGAERERYRRLLPSAARALFGQPRLWLAPALWRVALWRLASLARPTSRRHVARLTPPLFVLDLIAVHPAARKRGVAGSLLEGFHAAARARGARTLVLWVRREASDARRLYARHGWEPAWDFWPDRIAYVRRD
jgi:GNAT superfamily N-acetyltransferase